MNTEQLAAMAALTYYCGVPNEAAHRLIDRCGHQLAGPIVATVRDNQTKTHPQIADAVRSCCDVFAEQHPDLIRAATDPETAQAAEAMENEGAPAAPPAPAGEQPPAAPAAPEATPPAAADSAGSGTATVQPETAPAETASAEAVPAETAPAQPAAAE